MEKSKVVYCIRCEKPVEFRGAVLSLPPHNPEDMQKFCFDCAVEIAFLWSMDKKKGTYEGLKND